MTENQLEDGVIVAILDRFEKFRLPRTLEIKEKVDAGGLLDSADIAYLSEVLSDSESVKRYVDRRPDFQNLYARVVSLYQEITKKALENEQGGAAS